MCYESKSAGYIRHFCNVVRLAANIPNGYKGRICPVLGRILVEVKGVHREVEWKLLMVAIVSLVLIEETMAFSYF